MAFTSKLIASGLVKRTIQDINAHMISNVGDKVSIAIHLNMLDPSTRLWLVYLLDHLGNQKAKGGLISMCKICIPTGNGQSCYMPRDKFIMRYDKSPWMLVCPIAAAGGSIAGYNFEFDINKLKGKRPEDVINNIIFKRKWVYNASENPADFFPPQKRLGFNLRIPPSRSPSKYVSVIWNWCKSNEGVVVIGAALISKWAANTTLTCRVVGNYNFWNNISSGIAVGALAGFVVANTIKWTANKLDVNQWYISGNVVRIGGIVAGVTSAGIGTAMTLGIIPGGTLLGAVLISAGVIVTTSSKSEYIQKKKLCDISCI